MDLSTLTTVLPTLSLKILSVALNSQVDSVFRPPPVLVGSRSFGTPTLKLNSLSFYLCAAFYFRNSFRELLRLPIP